MPEMFTGAAKLPRMFAAIVALVALHVVPRPTEVRPASCRAGSIAIPRTIARTVDPGGYDLLRRRWKALGIAVPRPSPHAEVRFVRDGSIAPQGYRLRVDDRGVSIASAGADGAFYALTTLAQLASGRGSAARLPCVAIADAPQLRWRILSDDVSRGPLPTMRYFKERIRTIAAFKMNGYSPYMENVFVSPTDPLPAPLDGITPAQLRELDRYAARYHVAFIPEQQTFAHMHNTLRVERYAKAAEFPHGFLLSPNQPLSLRYLTRIITQELQAVPHPPFFHIGSDETATLGEGQTTAYVAAHGGRGAVYAAHVNEMARIIAPSGARVMLWDDGIEADPSIMAHLPKTAVIVNWHYGAQKTFEPYIRTIARGGFAQMVAPGANNWNRIFPDLHTALPNERLFIREGKAAHVLGLFQTVWNDDGETLYEATWYPVLYAAAAAWSTDDSLADFAADFPHAFFGVNDARYSRDALTLGGIDAQLGTDASDKLFWDDPFDDAVAEKLSDAALSRTRLEAERVEQDLYSVHPPLHANAARVMLLAARRYDALGRRYQIAREVRQYYADALLHPKDAVRDLFWCKYWFWEQRDNDEELAPLYAQAWRYESRPGHLASNLERYHLDAQRAIERADAIDRVTYEDYLVTKSLPPLDSVIGAPKAFR